MGDSDSSKLAVTGSLALDSLALAAVDGHGLYRAGVSARPVAPASHALQTSFGTVGSASRAVD